jgi:transcriptional regulator with XRE-family HTH domain
VAACYLSQVERGLGSVPTEERLTALARELREDPDIVLAHAGRIASDLQEAIIERPKLFGTLIRTLRDASDDDLMDLISEVRTRKRGE